MPTKFTFFIDKLFHYFGGVLHDRDTGTELVSIHNLVRKSPASRNRVYLTIPYTHDYVPFKLFTNCLFSSSLSLWLLGFLISFNVGLLTVYFYLRCWDFNNLATAVPESSSDQWNMPSLILAVDRIAMHMRKENDLTPPVFNFIYPNQNFPSSRANAVLFSF